jgi:hypothetical protein
MFRAWYRSGVTVTRGRSRSRSNGWVRIGSPFGGAAGAAPADCCRPWLLTRPPPPSPSKLGH